MKQNRGVALIVVLTMMVILTAIVTAIVLTTTATYRRADYFKTKMIAQQLAELGIADALYKLNYRYHDSIHWYGFKNTGECIPESTPGTGTPEFSSLHSQPYTIPLSSVGIPQTTSQDRITVSLQVNDSTDGDTLISTGFYQGRSVKISTTLRTAGGTLALPLNHPSSADIKGVPEAFNKHTAYAGYVLTHSAPSAVGGNIYTTNYHGTVNYKPNPWPATWSEATWTETDVIVSFPKPSFTISPFPIDIGEEDETLAHPNTDIFIDGQWHEHGAPGVSHTITSGGIPYCGGVVSYSGITDTYTFSSITTLYRIRVKRATSGISNGHASFSGSSSIYHYVKTDGRTSLGGTLTLGTAAAFDLNNSATATTSVITIISGLICNGDLILKDTSGSSSLPALFSQSCTLNGALCSEHSLLFNGGGSVTINAEGSSKPGAIMLFNPAAEGKYITIQDSPTLILGASQYAALINWSGGNSFTATAPPAEPGSIPIVSIQAPFHPVKALPGQATIIAYTQTNDSYVQIQSDLTGLVYSHSNAHNKWGAILLKQGNCRAVFTTSGYLYLYGGTLTYDSSAYRSNTTEIYRGFSGGRRTYLPSIWKIRW
jgi:hypothetical protein